MNLKNLNIFHGITVINEQGTIHINAVLALQNAYQKNSLKQAENKRLL